MTRNGATYHHLTDAQGSVTTVVDNAGQQADAYTPHGTARTTTETVPQHWRYTGAYLDPTGLYKMGARYHDPALARFTQPDPSGRETNTYAYTGGDPVNYTDLNGTSLLGLVSAALDWKSVIDVAGAASEDDSSGASASTAGTLAGAIPESTRGTAALAAGTPTGGIAAVGVGALCLGSGEFDGSQVEGALS
ncbi:RHS repeat-associated core domain-containing protein [Kitasatospora sp. NPDC088783]|uniref:RHS repeat-associated core domain-containing protein n=1 Tax=Kitasatospora sp. NPDC088783 TaxID=3364077 RepID=UPI00380D8DA8